MRNLKLTMTLALMFFSVSFMLADVIPGRWDKVASLAPGTRIVVEMQSGDVMRGSLAFTDAESLGINAETGNRMTVPKNAVLRVLEEKKGKKLTILGTAIGAAGGVVTGLAISANFDETFFARKDLMALTCGGIGALTGALIGNSIGGQDRQEVVFRSR